MRFIAQHKYTYQHTVLTVHACHMPYNAHAYRQYTCMVEYVGPDRHSIALNQEVTCQLIHSSKSNPFAIKLYTQPACKHFHANTVVSCLCVAVLEGREACASRDT